MGKRGMAKIVKLREKRIKDVIDFLHSFVKDVKKIYGCVTVILVGSYARGDFNVWSDIDVLVVVEKAESNPLRRYDNIIPVLLRYDLPIEPIIITRKEFFKGLKKKNPLIIDSLKYGKVILDELKICDKY